MPRILAFPPLPRSVMASEAQLPYRKAQKSGVCIQDVFGSAFHVFPPYPRHRRPLTGMRDGLLKAAVRSKPATELLAPSARSLMYLRMQAHTTRTAFATAATAVMTPLSRHSGIRLRTQTASHGPSDRRTATAARPVWLAVVPGSCRRPPCSILLRADRRRALAVDPGVSAPAEFSGGIRNTITIQRGTEKRGLYPRCVTVRVSRIHPVPPPPATTDGKEQRTPQSGGALTVKSVWSSACVALLWQRFWAVSSHLMYPRRPHDGSSESPLSEHTHVPQFSVREGRGAPPRMGHALPHTSLPPSSPKQRVPTTRPKHQVHTSTKHTTSA